MKRSNLWTLAAIVASGLAGCAHCDTCDDFPVPCNGPGCATSMTIVGPAPMADGPVMSSPMMMPAYEGESMATTPTITPPSLPEVPDAASPTPPVDTEIPPAPTLPPPSTSPENPS